jgi:hypothetical protein
MPKVMLVTPDEIPATYLRAVGYVLHQWSLFEWYIDLICRHLLGLPPKEARLVFSTMNMQAKLRIYQTLAEKVLPASDCKNRALKIGKVAEKLNEQRNKIVHGRWARPSDKKTALFHLSITGSSENRILPKATRMKSKDIRRLGDEIRNQWRGAQRVLSELRAQHDPQKNRLN